MMRSRGSYRTAELKSVNAQAIELPYEVSCIVAPFEFPKEISFVQSINLHLHILQLPINICRMNAIHCC